jgi:hypothetical protein
MGPSEAEERQVEDRARHRILSNPSPSVTASPIPETDPPAPPTHRERGRLYPFSEAGALASERPVSPFRLPSEIEAGLWEPAAYVPVLARGSGARTGPRG